MQKQAIVLSIIVFILIICVTVLSSYFVDNKIDSDKKDYYIEQEANIEKMTKDVVVNQVFSNLSDLNYITNMTKDYLFTNKELLEESWKSFMDNKAIYEKIRFINANGQEVIKVNYDEDGSVVANKSELQDESDNYYFQKTITLDSSSIYISKWDLNTEIPESIHPILRFSKVLNENDENIGIIVLNYDIENIMARLRESANTSNAEVVNLVNGEGGLIASLQDASLEWGFIDNDSNNMKSFSNENPEAWESIAKNESGVYEDSTGVYVFSEIKADQGTVIQNINAEDVTLGDENLYIVSYISSNNKLFYNWSSFAEYIKYSVNEQSGKIFLVLLAALSIAIFAYWNLISMMKIEFMSKYDIMTKAYNRSYGIAVSSKLYRTALKKGKKVGIIYCDLNGLKYINDTYGHEIGDEVIRSFSDSIVKEIRWKQRLFFSELIHKIYVFLFPNKRKSRINDIFLRMGGDEFLILFENTTEEQLENIWKRINSKFNELHIQNKRMSASHGSLSIESKMNLSLAEAIDIVDRRMYIEKEKFHRQIFK